MKISQLVLLMPILFSHIVKAEQLLVNQLGYLPHGDKIAYWLAPNSNDVSLISLGNSKQTFSLKVSSEDQLKDGQKLVKLDFSHIEQPGWYQLQSNKTLSAPFQITKHVYNSLGDRLVHALYLQRSGSQVTNNATGMNRPQSHLDDGIIFRSDEYHQKGEKIDVTGGWYDAGDYGKYVATATITIARLLEAYNLSPELFTSISSVSSSESHAPFALPAILEEAVYGLTWLEKMQREDGAVYRKVSGARWPGKITPWQDNQVRFIYGISTPETAKFAATMALAARTLKPHRPALSRRYLKMALHAWAYLDLNKEQYIDWQKGDDSGSGPYVKNAQDSEKSLDTDTDDRLWALAELYLTTLQTKYLTSFRQLYDKDLMAIFEWKNPMVMGVVHLMNSQSPKLDVTDQKLLRKDLLQLANRYQKQSNSTPFSIANNRFIWGSNKMTAEAGVAMAWADLAMNSQQYRSEVQSQIDYLLGANMFNLSFVTNTGTYAVRNLHHLYRIATGISLPGFMVGGPNEKAQSGIAPKNQGMLSYVDSDKSYAVNEFAIDYNASLIGLLAIHHSYFN